MTAWTVIDVRWWQKAGRGAEQSAILSPGEVVCPDCGGVGEQLAGRPTAGHPASRCWGCGGSGRLLGEFELVLLDTIGGRVLSRRVVAGELEAVQGPTGLVLPVGRVVAEMVEEVEGRYVFRPDHLRTLVPFDLAELDLDLPGSYADSEASVRAEMEAVVIGRRRRNGARHLVVTGPALPAVRDPDDVLREFATVADDLLLDLVLDVRTTGTWGALSWAVRLEVAGARTRSKEMALAESLPVALQGAELMTALKNVGRCLADTPAVWLTAGVSGSGDDARWPELSARLTPLAVGSGVGARAVRRNGAWHLSALRAEQDGLYVHDVRPPPDLAAASGSIDLVQCVRCAGAGCGRCGDTGRLLDGAVLTVTDLAGRTLHVNWHSVPHLERPERSGGTVLLDDLFSVRRQAEAAGLPSGCLIDLRTGDGLDHHLANGTVVVSDELDPVDEFVRRVGGRHPGGRVLVLAAEPAPADLTSALAQLRPLGLELHVFLARDRQDTGRGDQWSASVPGVVTVRRMPTLVDALQSLEQRLPVGLEKWLQGEALPVFDDEPRPPPAADGTLESTLAMVRDLYEGRGVGMAFGRAACVVAVDGLSPGGRGPGLWSAVAMFLALHLPVPEPDQVARVLREVFEGPEETSEADTEARLLFGLGMAGLIGIMVRERIGDEPDGLKQLAAELYRDALGGPGDEPVPTPEVFAELLSLLTGRRAGRTLDLDSTGLMPAVLQLFEHLMEPMGPGHRSDELIARASVRAVELAVEIRRQASVGLAADVSGFFL